MAQRPRHSKSGKWMGGGSFTCFECKGTYPMTNCIYGHLGPFGDNEHYCRKCAKELRITPFLDNFVLPRKARKRR